MGQSSGIAWTRSTFSPWYGCTKVSPGCDHCYAEALDARHKWGGATHWGSGVPRRRAAASTWRRAEYWNRMAAIEKQNGSCVAGTGRHQGAAGMAEGWSMPGFWPVFPSLCDPFDNEVPDAWRLDFSKLMCVTPNLTWLLLTKRIGNVMKMLSGDSMLHEALQRNAWLGVSVVNQEEADRDIPKLLAVPARTRFVSYEPALDWVDFTKIKTGDYTSFNALTGHGWRDYTDALRRPLSKIDQVIVGGESSQSGKVARPFNIEWARSTVKQCKEAGVAVFVKQMGSHCIRWDERLGAPVATRYRFKARAGTDPAEWPEDLRVQEFPK